MDDTSFRHVFLSDPFWVSRQKVNAEISIHHQWQMLEESHCFDNFRIAAGEKDGFREGWFFADSDAYKWLDAAARIYARWPSDQLKMRMDDFICLLRRTQMGDGYIFTYNQIHFPADRWENLMNEHELYCHGHLIGAGISHFETTGNKLAFNVARRAADLLVREFLVAEPDRTSGHEDGEIALLRLHRVTGDGRYLDLAHQFLERRGKVQAFAAHLICQNIRVNRRKRKVIDKKRAYQAGHPEHQIFQPQNDNYAKTTRSAKLRWIISGLSGKYFQMHAPSCCTSTCFQPFKGSQKQNCFDPWSTGILPGKPG
jgi:DUF1680 family protein